MRASAREFANLISRALISASDRSAPTRTWTPSLERTLHQLLLRDSLTPTLVARVIDPFLLDHHSLALGFFHWASQQPGFSHTAITYQSILRSLSASRQFNAVNKLLKQVRTHKIPLHPSVYRSVIASQIIGKKAQNAFSIFSEVSASIHEIGPATCNSLLAALSCDGLMECAHDVFAGMISRDVSLSTLGFGVFIWKFCQMSELGKTLNLLDEVRKKDFFSIDGSIIAFLVVHGLCLASRVSEAVSMLDELRSRDCKPDFMAYSIVVETLRLTGSIADVQMVLKKKRKLGVSPRTMDYREFIFTLISERLFGEAKEVGKVVVNGNFPIEHDVLNALIGSISATDPHCAILFLKFMLSRGGLPTLLTLRNLGRNLCNQGNNAEIVEVFNVLSDKEYFVDTESYNVMISFLCKAGRVKEAYQVLQEMKKKAVGPDVSSYNSVMEACCQEDLVRPAKRLWDEMFTNGCAGNLKTYNILIKKFSEVGQLEEADWLFTQMLEKGVAPNAVTYTTLLERLCQENKLKRAFEVFDKSIEQKNDLLAQTVLDAFVLHLCREGHLLDASKLLQDHAKDDTRSHVILLKYLADAGDIPIALHHLKSVRRKSPSMLHAICNELLSSLSSSSKSEPVLRFIQVMQGEDPSNSQ